METKYLRSFQPQPPVVHGVRRLGLAGLVMCIWFGGSAPLRAMDAAVTNATQQVQQSWGLREKLVWIGPVAPADAESSELLEVLNHMDQPWWAGGLDQFLKDYPHSPWRASVLNNYAAICRSMGRTTKALENWEAAWSVVQDDPSDNGRQLGGEILANWMDLLSSLGRLDKLKELIAIGDRWNFTNPRDRDKFQGAKNSYYLMESHPQVAYRCGTFALKAAGQILQPANHALDRLVELPSPTNGFSLFTLAGLSKQYGLNLVAVRRTAGEDLVVPSVVHWRQNHYAAILKRQDDFYLVSDPTFGNEKWMSAETINEEASGEFLIPATAQASSWTQLAQTESETIHGMGLPNNIRDGKDKGCNAGGTCPLCKGMPVWWVTEPYINLWIADEPLSYHTSLGESLALRLSFKQRDTRSSSGAQIYSPVTGWNNSWTSFVHVTDTIPCYCNHSFPYLPRSSATVYLADGGEVDFAPGQSYDTESRSTLMAQGAEFQPGVDYGNNGLRLINADGSQDVYGYSIPDTEIYGTPPEADFILTRHIDPHGNTIWFQLGYTNESYVMQFVIDYDGRTNTMTYTANGLLSQVTNPYGLTAHFKYDSNKNLTNIMDAAGMSSSVTYDANGNPTTLITPYGTNRFSLADNGLTYGGGAYGNAGGDLNQLIDRSALVVDPSQATNLYIYRYDSGAVLTATNFTGAPTNTPLGTLDTGTGASDDGLSAVYYRNSFHWGPRQYANLSTPSISNFLSSDYLLGRMQHWLQDTNDLYLTEFLSVKRDPSPLASGATEGLKTFYDYQGKTYNYREGTYDLPSVIAWCLPGGETHYEYYVYDAFGNVTNDITTYTLANGTFGTRTNQSLYANNTYTFTIGTWNGTTLIDTATSSYSVADLLTQTIGADGKPIAGYGGFDTVTWTNFFTNSYSLQISGTLLTSTRVLPDYATNGVGQVATNVYTGFDKIASTTSVAGLTTTNLYNSGGFLAQRIALQIARTNSFGYTTNGLVGAFTNELGLNLSATWDNLLRLTSVQYPDGTYVSNVYNKLDVGAVRDRLGNWTGYSYDGARRLTAITNANNAVTSFDWCGCGSLTEVIDPYNDTTGFNYDNQGNLTSVEFPDSSSVAYQYDLAARETSAADGAGRTLQFGYDNQGLMTTVSNAYGLARAVAYDLMDRPAFVTNQDLVGVTNTFDPLDRLLTRTWPNGATEGFGYAAQGLAFYTNQLSEITRYGYDAASRKVAETNANNEITRYGYDSAGDVLALTDGKNQTTTWGYNIYGLVTNKVDAAGNIIQTNGYNADNRLTTRWTVAKGATAYRYDPVGNLTNVVYPISTNLVLRYDAVNRLTNLVDAAGTNVFGYDPAGHLVSEDGPWPSDTVSYTYAQGLRTALSLSAPGGSWAQTYGFDSARRLASVASPAGTFGYGFYAPGSRLPVGVSLPNGGFITNNYDGLARLLSTKLVGSGGALLDAESYGYDAGNERTQQTFTAGNYVNYTYDPISQLLTATGKEAGGTPSRLQEQLGYGYDAAHNLHWRTNNALVQSFAVNSLNELTNVARTGTLTVAGTTTIPAASVTINGLAAGHYADATFALGGFTAVNGNNTYTAIGVDGAGNSATNSLTVNLPLTNSYSYDLNGNLVSDGPHGYDYDDENQLIRVTATNAWKSEFTYDGEFRRRIRKEFAWSGGAWVETNEVRYVYDGKVVIQERDTNNVPRVTYTRGNDLGGGLNRAGGIGGLLARTDTNGPAFYHADGNGNVTTLINTKQFVVANYEYDAFGNILSQFGPLANANLYRYSSKEFHPNSGLVYYLYRYYAPDLQRWVNRDPIGENGGINLYRFVGNDPVVMIDPSGLAQGYGNDVYGANGEAAGPSSYYAASISAPNGQFYNGNTYSVGPGPLGYDVATPQYGPDLDALNNLPLPGFPNFNPGIDAGGITDLSGDALGLYLAGAGAADLLGGDLGALKPNPSKQKFCPAKPPGTPIGRSGNPANVPKSNLPATINGRDYSGHALDQMQGRGIPPSVVENTIQNGTPFSGNTPAEIGYSDPNNNVSVIVNANSGNVVTVIPSAK